MSSLTGICALCIKFGVEFPMVPLYSNESEWCKINNVEKCFGKQIRFVVCVCDIYDVLLAVLYVHICIGRPVAHIDSE